MRIDEAIKHAEEVAEEKQAIVDACDYYGDDMVKCEKCGEEHRQLAEWLKELKQLREQARCENAISRQAAIDVVRKWFDKTQLNGDICLDGLVSLPPVIPQQKTGQLEHLNKWVSASEMSPKERDWYLGIFKEPDTGWINPLPYICDYVGTKTASTTKDYWILHGFTDREDEHIDYYFNLECVTWTSLPKPYNPESEERI